MPEGNDPTGRSGRQFPISIQMATFAFFASVFALVSSVLAGEQAPNQITTGQQFGSIAITLGMPESEAIRRLSEEFSVTPVSNVPGLLMIKNKQAPGDSVGSVNVRNGRVVLVSSEWTPRVDRAGALGEVIFTLLTRLTAPGTQAGWRSAVSCTVETSDGLTVGTDTQVRLANILCGGQTITLSISRVNGGTSQVQVQLVTK